MVAETTVFFSGPRCSAFLDHNLSKNPQKDWTDNPPELFDDSLTIVFLDMRQSVNLSLVLCWYVCVCSVSDSANG